MKAWRHGISTDTQNTTNREDSSLPNRVNKNLVFSFNISNTDRPVNSTVDNCKSLSKTNSVQGRPENHAFLSVIAHRLQILEKMQP